MVTPIDSPGSSPSPGAGRDARIRTAGLILCLAIAAAFVVLAWSRLAVPYSTGEAAFVHDALRESGQVISPDFTNETNHAPAKVLVVIMQLVGSAERPLRLVFILMLLVAACVLSELLFEPRAVTSAIVLLGFLAIPAVPAANIVVSCTLILFPASLALLAAPVGPPVTNCRAILGLVGSLMTGALSFEAGVAVGALLLGASVIRGSALERMTALATGAAGIAMGAVTHSSFVRPRFQIPELPAWLFPTIVVALGLAALFVRNQHRRQRLAVFVSVVVGGAAGLAFLSGEVSLGSRLAVCATLPALLLLLAVSADAFGAIARILIAALLVVAIVCQVRWVEVRGPRSAGAILDEARTITLPQSALVFTDSDREQIAVYARLGHAPMMPVIYLPEHAAYENLAELCRQLSIKHIFLHPPSGPPGFVRPESQPTGTPSFLQLDLEGS